MAQVNVILLEMGIALIISVVASQPRSLQSHELRNKVFVYLHEFCYYPDFVDENIIRTKIIEELPVEFEVVFSNNKDLCTNDSLVLSIILKEMEDQRTIAIIGSTEPSLCDIISKYANIHKKLFISWNCPQVDERQHYFQSYTSRLSPPVRDVVGAILSLFKYFRWKRATIVTVEKSAWWLRMGIELEFFLSYEKISSSTNTFVVLPVNSDETFIERRMRQVTATIKLNSFSESYSNEAIVLCISEYSHVYKNIMRVLTKLQPTIPIIVMKLSSNFYDYFSNMTATPVIFENYHPIHKFYEAGVHDNVDDYFTGGLCPNRVAKTNEEATELHTSETSKTTNTKADLSDIARENLEYFFLFISPIVKKHDPKEWFHILLEESTKIIRNRTLFENNHTTAVTDEIQFLLSDFVDLDSSFRQILMLYRNKSVCMPTITESYRVEESIPNVDKWFQDKLRMKYNETRIRNNSLPDCIDCAESDFEITWGLICLAFFILAVIIILLSGFLLVFRKQYIKRRRLKDPCKILLTSEDLVFPHLTESGKVQEGIGAVLCYCIRELREIDGPEVDKPDLLKGRDDSVKSFPLKNVNSSNSTVIPITSSESKARYNGDLVQLKAILTQGGSFELRNKSLNILVMIHGLRHENLNPLIGLLADPARPALVWEYCSRGSLEDVLMQDEIKLDWSFRLSLLTDLVRGMKYLHSYPYRVHGSLTSRNCVIDARWVLKITDYCLADFYNAQSIADIQKNARELLWTAPELLRDQNLLRKGTQQGDIYSFAIIMQEVVVRGEPFCMLALKPDDIIEKLKSPPPLIRPSVSKGAAPPEAINIMRQCWSEQPEKRPDFNAIYDLFKTLNHGRKINFVDTMFQMLEKYSNNLEDLIRERTEQLDMEKKKTEQLLNRMLPYSVAEKLKLGMHVDPEEFSEVTIYFSDIVGFTTISAYSTPFEVVDLLNDLYTCFDATINAYNVYKVETIGDAYMVVGGLPVCIPDHADQIATMALDLLHQSGQFKIRHLPLTPLRLRIGLHTGPCCAGVVGLTMPRYCLFGDTVNTASRLESTGSPGRIHISETTKLKLDSVGKYELEYRGETELKGKGKMPTYWLLGKEGFDKEIPVPPPITLDEELIRKCSSRSQRDTLMKHASESSVEHELATNVMHNQNRPLILQKSLDSGLPSDGNSSHMHKSWMTRRQMTFDLSNCNNKSSTTFDYKMGLIPETSEKLTHFEAVKTHIASDKNVDSPLGSRNNVVGGSIKGRKYAGSDAENDLSEPYNHYRCLPPTDANITSSSKFVSKFLKRQFSVDKSDDTAIVLQEIPISRSARLFKQNSTGTYYEAADKTDKSQVYKFNNNNVLASISVSNESLS